MMSIFIINDMTPKEKKAAYNLAWYHKNKGGKGNKVKTPEQKEQHREYMSEWRDKKGEEWKDYMKKYNLKNKDKINKQASVYHKQRKQADPLFKLKQNTSNLIRGVFKTKGLKKNSKTLDILGCTWDEFKQHIESQFEPWMNWDNRGGWDVSGPDVTWDLDHIIPVSSAVNEDDIKRLNHHTNFQPLCSYNNRFIKKDKQKSE